jgi:hypothetical protein
VTICRSVYSYSHALTIALALAVPVWSHAQGVQTGVLSGVVRDPQDLPLPGATVTATSPSMQGERTAVTDAIGCIHHPRSAAGNLQCQVPVCRHR